MNPRNVIAKSLVLSVVLFCLALAASSANAQEGIPQGYMEQPSGNLVVGSPIIFTCIVSDIGSSPASEFADGITISGPDYLSHVGTATLEGNTAVVTYTTTLANTGSYSTWCLGGLAQENTVTFTVGAASYQGLVYPKFLVVGVSYAPPGTSNYIEYTDTSAIGTTTTYSYAFSDDVGYSVSTSIGFDIKGGSTGTGGGVTWTSTYATDLTQTENASKSVTTNTSVMNGYKISGYPTTISPSGTLAGTLPNDYDLIWLWLNPELSFTVTAASGSTPASIQWGGYGYDPADEAGPDIYPVPAGCLNGDFLTGAFYTANPTYCNPALDELVRAWVYTSETLMSPTSEVAVTASGCASQTAESPSICPKTQDAYNILASDPLAYNPGGSAYTLLNSDPLPTTTSDGRFTQYAYPPNPIPYEYGDTDLYSLTQMNTETQSAGGSTQLKQKITVSEKVSASFLKIWQASVTYTFTDTITQTNSWLTTLTQTQTNSESFSVEGSNPTYVAPEFIVFQDNQYGTMMMYPNN